MGDGNFHSAAMAMGCHRVSCQCLGVWQERGCGTVTPAQAGVHGVLSESASACVNNKMQK